MALRDAYGNSILTASQVARDHYDRGVHLFLGAEFGASDAFSAAVAEDPGFTLGHAALARALMMEGRMPDAKAAFARAEAASDPKDARETGHVRALGHLFAGNPVAARAAVREHVYAYPRDALIAQMCTNVFGLIGFSGEVGREAELLAYTEALLPHYGEDWWMMSMHALSLCETGQIGKSMILMDRALALNPRNGNGAHFKAHAQYEAGETAPGRRYLQDWMSGYDSRSVLHGHLSWHLALWALQDGDIDAMWTMIDTGIGPGASNGLPINVLTDTVAILYRAELAGVTVSPDRWRAISTYAAQFFPETGQSFADLHAALGHAMAGQGDHLDRLCREAKGFAGDMVRPAAQAWRAIAQGDWTAALDHLSVIMASTERVGGSRAQRDLIELAYVNVLMKLGLDAEARRALRLRRPVLAAAPPVVGMH